MNSAWRMASGLLVLAWAAALLVGCGGGGGGKVSQVVTGRVLLGDTEQPAANVQVKIGDYAVVVTDNNGRFAVQDVAAPATYRVTVTSVPQGYRNFEADIKIEKGTGDPRTWDMGVIYLAPAPPQPPQLG